MKILSFLSQASSKLLPRVSSKAPCCKICSPVEGLSIASFWTCWSQSMHEPKYSPEDDAKSSFTVPHTLSRRAALCLCQFSSLGDSTAQAAAQNPISYQCVMDFHYTVRLACCLLASIPFLKSFPIFFCCLV